MQARQTDDRFPYEARFFVLRAPALPTVALDPVLDEARTHDALRALAADPLVREALWLASPDLIQALERWERDPHHPSARNVPRGLYRYLARMARRPTPFGLFAGVAMGEIGASTQLELSSVRRRHTRLDMAWLTALLRALEPTLRDRLRYRPNTSLYRSAGQLRYAEARYTQTRARKNEQIALSATPAIDAVLAATPAGVGELIAVVRDLYPEVDDEAARQFVETLIEGQLLLPELILPVTADDPLDALIAQLRPLAPELAEDLAGIHEALRALDAAGPGQPVERYGPVSARVEGLPATSDPGQLYHVDLHLQGELRLGPEVIRAIEEAARVLRQITPWEEDPNLVRLREGFTRRFGGGCWPMTDVLDGERGLGFEGQALSSDPSPLLAELPFPGDQDSSRPPFGARERWMMRRIVEAGPGGEWALDEADLEAMRVEPGPPLPDSFCFMGHLEGGGAAGALRLHVTGFTGPPGARLLGRFSLGDAAMRAAVLDHVRAEEAWAPDAIFAEVVHVPEGRAGNVLARPRLRPVEIPYLGEGAAPPDQQIKLEDLYLSMPDHDGQRLLLHSARLGREVLPRLSSAHNHGGGDLLIYRFLGALQSQGVRGSLHWSWGILAESPFLPRVRWGEIVLSPASWRLDEAELRPLVAARGETRAREARRLREVRRLPRRLSLVQGDNLLPLDLESPLALDALAAAAEKGEALVLREETRDEALCVRGPGGAYTHEIVVPFERARGEVRRTPIPRPSSATRAWMPGSPWLYARIYTGTLTTDAVLAEVALPLLQEARAEGALERWHFLRYIDQDWHLRLRLKLDPSRVGATLARLHEALAPWLADRRVWRLDLDTYQPEVERYGGDDGIGLAERLFEADSEAAAHIVSLLNGDEGADARWRLALRSAHLLLEDLEIPVPQRVALLRRWRAHYAGVFRIDKPFDIKLNQRLRELWASTAPLIEPSWSEDHPSAPGLELLAARSEALRPLAAELRALEAAGRLLHPVEELANSFVHMSLNRLLRSDANRQELVIYDLLARLYHSQLARRGG